MSTNKSSAFSKFNKMYRSVAVLGANTIVLFVMINVFAWIFLRACSSNSGDPVSNRYGDEAVFSVYPEKSRDEVIQLLSETWSRPYQYEPFTQFKERPYSGKYVNVTAEGYRPIANQAPWPPVAANYNVFVFGGSTMFGYGVADNETAPSYLQEALKSTSIEGKSIAVYNLGRGHYYSTQERTLYEQLLLKGIVPDMALFVDGLNDFYYASDEPFLTPQFHEFVEGDRKKKMMRLLGRLPIMQAIASDDGFPEEREEDEQKYNDAAVIKMVLNRYLGNKRLIELASQSYGVQAVFVWQPVPTYKYDDVSHHLFRGKGYLEHTYSRFGYPVLRQQLDSLGNQFIWLADIQEQKQEPLYVDKVHYSAAFNSEIAELLAKELLQRNLFVPATLEADSLQSDSL